MKKIVVLLFCLFSFSSYASDLDYLIDIANCPKGGSNTEANFCPSFKEIAICHCRSWGLPGFMCKTVKQIYNRMLFVYSTVENACESQKETSKQDCIDSWNCYWNGGSNSTGGLCSSTGERCEVLD